MQGTCRLVFNSETQLADGARAIGPFGWILGKLRQMLFIREARQAIVGLGLQVRARDAPLCHGGKIGQPPAGDQIADQRGNENGLARPREARHAETQGRGGEVGKAQSGPSEGFRRCVGNIGKSHAGACSASSPLERGLPARYAFPAAGTAPAAGYNLPLSAGPP
jgi:hypothetical protein